MSYGFIPFKYSFLTCKIVCDGRRVRHPGETCYPYARETLDRLSGQAAPVCKIATEAHKVTILFFFFLVSRERVYQC